MIRKSTKQSELGVAHKAKKIREDNPSPPQAATPEVLEWDDLTPYQQWMVEEGRKTAIEMPDTVQNGEQWMEWFRSLR
jgi:hypothetical protein